MVTDTPLPSSLVPAQDDLTSIPRELRFVPVENAAPETLTPAQIAHYNAQGYIRPVTVFGADEIADLRAYFDDLLARTLASGGDAYSITTAHKKYGRVYDILRNERIVACVRDLLGPDVIGWGAHFFCKLPHDPRQVSWHQDAVYWPLTPTKTVTVWLAVDDADAQNACMRFVPGSHRHGPLMHLPSQAHEDNVLNLKVDRPEQYGTPVDDELRAGQVSLHSDLLLHGSEPNRSPRRRCGLTLRYCAADVRAYLGWEQKGVVVSGQDALGRWANFGRPAQD